MKKLDRMKKKQIKQILRIVFILASISSLYFVPWILVKAWIMPLPNSVQEQLEEGIGHGFDGMIVYIDQAGKPPEFYAAGWHDRKNKIPANPKALFKIASITKINVDMIKIVLVFIVKYFIFFAYSVPAFRQSPFDYELI